MHESSGAQSRPTLCDPMICSLPGPSLHVFSRHEYWSGMPCPPPGDRPDPGVEPKSTTIAGGFFNLRVTWEAPIG